MLLGVCIMTCFALVSTAPAFAASKPGAETKAATGLHDTEATLQGKVNPEELETKYFFEYGTTTSYGSKTAEVSAGSGTTGVEASAVLTGLKENTKYDFRIVATNSDGTADGANASFTTTDIPEFKPSKTEKFTATLSATHWVSGGFVFNEINCKGGTSNGEILSATTIGNLHVVFTGCEAVDGSSKCNVNSDGAREGEILTNSLTGELGTVATSEAASGVGLLISAGSHGWTELAGSSCTEESGMSGTLALEVKVVGKKQVSNELVSANKIKKITLDSGKVESPKLDAFSQAVTIEGQDALTFAEATEVT
jgi:hypothetical protein